VSLAKSVRDTTRGFAELVRTMMGVAAKLERRRTHEHSAKGLRREIPMQADLDPTPAEGSMSAGLGRRAAAQRRPQPQPGGDDL
jgi:hypothetical protein